MNAVNPILDQPKDKEALTLLFMSLEDVHEPRGRLLTGGCRLVRDDSPPEGLEEDLNEFAQDLALTSLQEPDGAIHVWYSLRRSPERFLVESLSAEQASARSHSESDKTFSITRPEWDPARLKWQVCYARTRDGIHFERPDLGIVPDARSPNVLIDNGGIFSVMRNDEATDPNRRYAMIHTGWGPRARRRSVAGASSSPQRWRSLFSGWSALARVGSQPGLPRRQRRLFGYL